VGTPAGILFAALVIGQVQQDDKLKASDAVKAAREDLVKIPEGLRHNIRYLSLHNWDLKKRAYFRPTLSGHANKLSRLSKIEPLRIGGPRGEILRVDLTQYGWTADLWEKLADPYFTEAGYADRYEDEEWGRWDYSTGVKKWIKTETKKKLVKGRTAIRIASWLDADPNMRDLFRWTGSYVPVSRADWWFNQTAAAEDRAAGYYDWLGIKDEASFAKLVGVIEDESRKRRFELRESVGESGVATHRVRAIVRDDALGGGRWKTFDFDNAKDARQALINLGRDVEKTNWKATEQYGFLPNNLWAVGAFDRQGKIAKSVPGNVANDHASRSNDKRIHNGVSCFRCHTNGGLQDIDEWARSNLNAPLALNTTDYKKYVELREQYLRDLTAFVKRDRSQYEEAIKEATGLDSKEDSKRYAELWELYEDAKVDTAHAARDLGLETEEFRERLLDFIKSYTYSPSGEFDLVAAALIHKGPKTRAIPIHQYEEVILQLYRATAFPSVKSQKVPP
jgi:hypothetical protein